MTEMYSYLDSEKRITFVFCTIKQINFHQRTILYKHLHTSSSSSYRAGSTDIPDPLSPLLPIVHHPR